MQFSRQLSVFRSALLLCALTGAGPAALLASAGSPSSLGLLAAGLAVGLIGLTMLPRHWKTLAPIEQYTDASSGSAEVPSLALIAAAWDPLLTALGMCMVARSTSA